MNKMLEILKKMGATDELANRFVSEMRAWKKASEEAIHEQFQADYVKRLQKAKQACLAETTRYKEDLARRVEVFLEARVNTINREASKQAAIGESEASKTLRGVKSLLEGVNLELPDLQTAEETKKLRAKVGQLQERCQQLIVKNGHANKIARKLIERQRILETKLEAKLEKAPRARSVTESKRTGGKNAVKELKVLQEQAATPKTTRKRGKALEERKPARTNEQLTKSDHPEVMAIAESLDGKPAVIVD